MPIDDAERNKRNKERQRLKREQLKAEEDPVQKAWELKVRQVAEEWLRAERDEKKVKELEAAQAVIQKKLHTLLMKMGDVSTPPTNMPSYEDALKILSKNPANLKLLRAEHDQLTQV
jgi:DNA-directed RNA polymerase beta subunit